MVFQDDMPPLILRELLREAAAEARPKAAAGRCASYIPELAAVDPGLLGLAAATLEGEVISCGDDDAVFSMQSVSKPAALAFALHTLGREKVFSKIGMEPCSEPFNSIMKLEMTSSVPLNPFINSGAIVLSGMIGGAAGPRALEEMRVFFGRLMGRKSPVRVLDAVYRSENETADRNRALAYFLHNTGVLTGAVEETLALYFKMCSFAVTVRDLAVMGGTFASGGVNPVSGERVISVEAAYVLCGLMRVCGLYDESARFAVDVGLPGKSGVSGAIMCAVPGRMGLAVFSPPLNERGNSVAGMAALSYVSRRLRLRGF